MSNPFLLFTVALGIFVVFSFSAVAGMQGVTSVTPDCGYDFLPHEKNQLEKAGWQCTKDDAAGPGFLGLTGFIAF